jgi:hypothetical protein
MGLLTGTWLLETVYQPIKTRLAAISEGFNVSPKPELEDIFRDPSPEKRKAFIAQMQEWDYDEDDQMAE